MTGSLSVRRAINCDRASRSVRPAAIGSPARLMTTSGRALLSASRSMPPDAGSHETPVASLTSGPTSAAAVQQTKAKGVLDNIDVVAVRVWETPMSIAEYRGE